MHRDNYHVVVVAFTINNLDLERLRFGGVTVTGFQLNDFSGSNVSI